MHEYSLACEIFENVMETAQANNAYAVNSITINIGRLAHVNPEQLLFSFSVISKNSIANGAKVNVEFIEPTIECICGYEGTIDNVGKSRGTEYQPYLPEYMGFKCPMCNELLQTVGGRELIIKAIDIDQE